jgi:hypothetical protein
MASKKEYYAGVWFAPYDLVKEFLIALLVVSALVIALAAALSSSDVPPMTLKTAAVQMPRAFAQGALNQLDGQSDTATYGPPYNNTAGASQNLGPIDPQAWFGVHIPIATATTYVLGPLDRSQAGDAALNRALGQYKTASDMQRRTWEEAYGKALEQSTERGSLLTLPPCACGPVALMIGRVVALGQSGALDGLLLTSGHFFQTDYTRPVLFLADAQDPVTGNSAFQNAADKQNLLGETWGVMNETGSYPGQAWLWLYTAIYQVPPFSGPLNVLGTGLVIDWSASADLLAILTITLLTAILMFIPWIPGLRQVPRRIPIYKLIWRDHYRSRRRDLNA